MSHSLLFPTIFIIDLRPGKFYPGFLVLCFVRFVMFGCQPLPFYGVISFFYGNMVKNCFSVPSLYGRTIFVFKICFIQCNMGVC